MSSQIESPSDDRTSAKGNAFSCPRSEGRDQGSATWFAALVLSCISGLVMGAVAFWLGATFSQSVIVYVAISFLFFSAVMIVLALSDGKGL